MPPLAVIELKIVSEPTPGLGNRTVSFQIYVLIFYAPPQPFYEHIVQSTALAVHADIYAVTFKNPNKCIRSELAALVRIEDFGNSVPRDRLL